MTASTLKPWFEYVLCKSFPSYPTRAVERSLDAFVKVREIFACDFCRAHSKSIWNDEAACAEMIYVNAPLQAVLIYRIAHVIYLDDPSDHLLSVLANIMRLKTGAEIYYSAQIGPGFNIQHGMGTVIGPRHKIGSNFTIHQGCTLGQRRLGCPEESIEVGDRVTIFAGAVLLGSIHIGDDVKVGANAVLLTDAETGGTYAGIPAKRVA